MVGYRHQGSLRWVVFARRLRRGGLRDEFPGSPWDSPNVFILNCSSLPECELKRRLLDRIGPAAFTIGRLAHLGVPLGPGGEDLSLGPACGEVLGVRRCARGTWALA